MDTAGHVSIAVKPITDRATLRQMDRHGRGQGTTARERRRPDATHRALAYSWRDGRLHLRGGLDGGRSGAGFDVVGAYRRFKDARGLSEWPRSGTAFTQHAILGVPASWVAEIGDPNDPRNPRVIGLLKAAVKWGNEEYGGDVGESVYAARYDLDEMGSAKVDLFLAPARTGRGGKRWISVRSADRALPKRIVDGKPESDREALHTRWAFVANRELGTNFGRGEYVARTGGKRRHVESPEIFGARRDAEREAALDDREAAMDKREDQIDDRHRDVEAKAVENTRTHIALGVRRRALDEEAAELDQVADAIEGVAEAADGLRGYASESALHPLNAAAAQLVTTARVRRRRRRRNAERRKAIDAARARKAGHEGHER